MNKAELIDIVAECAGISKAQTGRVIECYHDAIQGSLVKGEPVRVRGFGAYTISTRPARIGRNPQTGKVINISEKKVVKFKPGADLSESI